MLLSFLLILQLWAQEPEAHHIKPIVIEDRSPEIVHQPRSIDWPVVVEKNNPAINQPQVDDALNAMSGLQTRTQGSPTFSIRGSSQLGRVLVLYNDIPLNFSSTLGAPRIFLPKELVGQVNIIKGPASLFYGSQAMAGSVNFQPRVIKSPEATWTLADTNESFLPGREGGLAYNSITVATPLVTNDHTHIQASYFNENDDGEFPFQTQNGSGVRSFNSQNSQRVTLNGSTQGSWWSLNFDSIFAKETLQSPGGLDFPFPTSSNTEGALVSVTPQFFFNDQMSLKSRLSYLESNAEFESSFPTSINNQKTLISQNEWIYDFNGKTQLQFFADYFNQSLDNTFDGTGLTQDQFELGPFFSFFSLENLRHQLGGRYLNRGDKFLPSLTTSYLWQHSETWLSYSEGFRNPTVSDRFSNSPTFIGNPDLEPERSEQVELGYKIYRNKSLVQWSADIRLFHIDYKNFIESFAVSPGILSRTNEGKGWSRGGDLSTEITHLNLHAKLSYNFLETRKKSNGEPFRLSPRHQLSWAFDYNFGLFKAEMQNVHWYKFYDVNTSNSQTEALDNWQQWNFFIHSKSFSGFSLSLGLINAFNEGKELTLFYPEPQRKYWLQARYTY